jgi:hypothetical protein
MLFVCPADELGRVLGALHVRGPIVGLVLLSEVLIPARLLPALPAADEGLTSREETPEIFRDPASRSIPHVASTWAWSPRGSRPSSTRETPDTPLLLPHALPPHVPYSRCYLFAIQKSNSITSSPMRVSSEPILRCSSSLKDNARAKHHR